MSDKTNNVQTEYVGKKTQIDPSESQRWWNATTCHSNLFAELSRMETHQSYHTALNVKHARLYSNLELLGLSVHYNGSTSGQKAGIDTNRVTYNLVKSCVDTAASKIAKNHPKPQFLTSGGDYEKQDRAKKLTKYLEGVFYATDYYDKAAKSFVDGAVFGTGVLKFFKQDGQIRCERVIPEEIKIDDQDGLYGRPKNLSQSKQVSRDALAEQYTEHTAAIYQATSSTPTSSSVDLIRIVEAWHLGKTNGKHVICIENATLFEEEYTKDYFPFVFYRWNDRLTGFFGQGLSEELAGTQLEINRTLKNIHLAQKLVAIPRVAIESNAGISVSQLTNDVGSVIRYQAGTRPPVFNTPTGMNAEVYNHLKWLIQSGYEKTGISQMAATSKKPAGLDSGAALREYSDIETERFMLTAMKYEKMSLDASKIIIDLSRDLFTEDPKLAVNVPGREFINTIKWSDVNLADDQFIMKLFPVGLLPTTPAGRLAKVQELIQAGWVSKEKALELLDFPDLEAFQSLETANANLVSKNIGEMLSKGKYMPPEPQMDLSMAISTALKHYLKGRADELPEERLELLLRFMDDAERLEEQKAQQVAPAATPEAAAPQAVAEALPETDMLPLA